MRSTFTAEVSSLLDLDPRHVVLLGDIGVFGFSDAAARHPGRVLNVGILEQTMVGIAAGLASTGLIPTLHTIAPFLVERAFEQLKVDFGYQGLSANLVTVGASFDYASLGATHHCPGDIALLGTIPGMRIFVPGTAQEFSALFRQAASSRTLNYFRLSEAVNERSEDVSEGHSLLLREGSKACVVAYGPTKDAVMLATQGLDVSVLYYTTIRPFDAELLRNQAHSGRVVLVEPFYRFSTSDLVLDALAGRPVQIHSIGVPRVFRSAYGLPSEHLEDIGLTPAGIRHQLLEVICD